MEMVSVAKMKKSTDMANRGRAYARFTLDLLSHISSMQGITHPLLEVKEKPSNKELVIAISSNKGLAGAYNTNISKALAEYKKKTSNKIDTLTIGKQSEKSARRSNLDIIASFIHFSEKSSSDEFLVIRDMVIEKFMSGDYDKVSVLYTEWKSATTYKPFLIQILPIVPSIYQNHLFEDELVPHQAQSARPDDSGRSGGDFREYKFEPDEKSVLEQVVPQAVALALYPSFVESLASEHSARMFAMKNANDNAGEILDNLTLFYNQARQAAITQEISEIVGGAAAVG